MVGPSEGQGAPFPDTSWLWFCIYGLFNLSIRTNNSSSMIFHFTYRFELLWVSFFIVSLFFQFAFNLRQFKSKLFWIGFFFKPKMLRTLSFLSQTFFIHATKSTKATTQRSQPSVLFSNSNHFLLRRQTLCVIWFLLFQWKRQRHSCVLLVG